MAGASTPTLVSCSSSVNLMGSGAMVAMSRFRRRPRGEEEPTILCRRASQGGSCLAGDLVIRKDGGKENGRSSPKRRASQRE